jgi:ubiquinol-cytochrome c reductase cytochrome b subunit
MAGVLLLLLTLGFAFTGSLLPWDQNAYWVAQVGVNILGTAPLAGPALQRLIQGGSQIGNLTLTRFYTLHVIVLPLAVAALVALHLALFLRRGATPHWSLSREAQARQRQPFWPGQFGRDAWAMLAVLALLLLLAMKAPTEIGAPADPSRPYDARPEWYFLPLFEMLKLFEGPLEPIGTFVLPAAAILFLFVVPFLDRSPERSPRRRLAVVVPMLAGLLAAGGLTLKSTLAGRSERAQRLAAEKRREQVLAEGRALVDAQRCLKCHTIGGEGRDVGPNFSRYGLTAPPADAIMAHLKNPQARFPQTIMPSFAHLPEEDLRRLAEFLRLQGVD